MLAAKGSDELLGGAAIGIGRGANSARNSTRDKLGIFQRRKLDESDTVGEPWQNETRDLESELRLADSAGAGKRHQPVPGNEVRQPDKLVFAAEQLGDGGRQICARFGSGFSGDNPYRRG
jgi:hypothetical protein